MKAEMVPFAGLPEILPPAPVISIAGAGGKTTLMFALAGQLQGTAVTTTTTKVGADQIKTAGQRTTLNRFPPAVPAKTIWVSPDLTPQNGKIIGCGPAEFAVLAEICRGNGWALIAETDGAARRPLKAPASHEPVIPAECNVCFYLAGLNAIGLPLDAEHIHRPECYGGITGLQPGTSVTAESVVRLMDHPDGGMKNVPPGALRIAFLTHGDTPERLSAGRFIAGNLQQYDYVCIH